MAGLFDQLQYHTEYVKYATHSTRRAGEIKDAQYKNLSIVIMPDEIMFCNEQRLNDSFQQKWIIDLLICEKNGICV